MDRQADFSCLRHQRFPFFYIGFRQFAVAVRGSFRLFFLESVRKSEQFFLFHPGLYGLH